MKKFLSFILPIFLLAGCGNESVEKTSPQPVKIIQADKTKHAQIENYPGVVKGRYETAMSFQVGGKIISRNVQVGNFVNAGDVLMTIDPKDVLEQTRTTDAQVSAAEAKLNFAKSNLERYKELFKSDAISAATLEQYQTQYDSALAEYNSAVAQSRQSKNSLGYTNLTANNSGVISAINAEVGQVVSAGQTVLNLVQTNELEIEINVPENKISSVQIGQPAEINFWANENILSGRVREISPIADSNSRTFAVKISLDNAPQNVQLGMTSNVILKSQTPTTDKIILPLSAIYQSGNKTQVWIVTDENKTALKDVTVENFSDNEVIVNGISATDKIISAGVHKIREGQEVRILEADR